ncbi:PsbP-related protein [Methanobrevibacter sp.]
MKKCPECGNPSYDGAPVCGNCGYKFPKPKAAVRREESIFQETQREKKSSNDESIVDILKEKKLIIGIILIITFIVICGIIITGNNGNNSNIASTIQSGDMIKYDQGDFSFAYPSSWQQINQTDEDIEGAVFFQDENNTVIEYYNISSDASSLKDINQERISYALENGNAIELVETITLDGRNASNMIWENADGNYTRYVSMFTDGKVYVFKATGSSINAINSEGIDNLIKTADII